MNWQDWLFGLSSEKTMQRHELLRHNLYQSIQDETDRHKNENSRLIERYKALYEAFRKGENTDEQFREALDCLCSYCYEWCRHNDASAEIERKYDKEFNKVVYESLPLLHKIAYKMENGWKSK